MKKLILVFVLFLLITNVYAFSFNDKISSFSIKDVLTSFSIIDFFNKLFGIEEGVVGINIESDTKVKKNIETSVVNQPVQDTSNVIEQPITSPQQIEEAVEDSSGVINIITQEPIVITQEDNIQEVVPVPILNGYLSVATLKESYSVNEVINLTDPPKEEEFFSKLIDGIKGIFKKSVKGIKIDKNKFTEQPKLTLDNNEIFSSDEIKLFSLEEDSHIEILSVNQMFDLVYEPEISEREKEENYSVIYQEIISDLKILDEEIFSISVNGYTTVAMLHK